MERPRSATKSSVKPVSATPRMSYSRKTLGFMSSAPSEQVVPAGLPSRLDELAHILRTILGDDQHGVAGRHHHQVLHPQHPHVRRPLLGDDDVAVAVQDR